jgi:hypothetical protein
MLLVDEAYCVFCKMEATSFENPIILCDKFCGNGQHLN